jgi:hypothetical protein
MSGKYPIFAYIFVDEVKLKKLILNLARRQPVSKPEKVSLASKRQALKLPPNVGLVDYLYQDVDYRRRQWMKLSAHLLQGVDIKPDPKRPANHLVR